MLQSSSAAEAQKDKNHAAMTSVVAAVGLTTFKIIVGVLTGSLGILAEAAHSALDLVAAVVTMVAVRVSGKPADQEHTFGHGKVENLSALFETLLLLGTCVWIIYEAIQRLFVPGKAVEVEPSIWAFIVMFVSIWIDFTRSRVLDRAAKKYNSQALEADALHFSTDIWSSSVVIFGLLLVQIGRWVPSLAFLSSADAIAAMGVAGIVVYVSMKLGVRTVQALLDAAPSGLEPKIKAAAEAVAGVFFTHHIRVRHSGPDLFIDIHVKMDADMSLQESHALGHRVADAIRKELGQQADVDVHAEPYRPPEPPPEPPAEPPADASLPS